MQPSTFLRRVRITNLFGVCGDIEIAPRSNLWILVGPNQAGKSKLLEAILVGFGVLSDPLRPDLINWYGAETGRPETRGAVELDIETNSLVPLQDQTVSSAFVRRDIEPLGSLIGVKVHRDFFVRSAAPGRVNHGEFRMTCTDSRNRHDWGGLKVPDSVLPSLLYYIDCNSEFAMPPRVSVGDQSAGSVLLQAAWNVTTDAEAVAQANNVPRKHLVDMDAKSAARLRGELPKTLPEHLSIAVTRDSAKGNSAELDLYDHVRGRRLDGVELSNGNRRAMLVEMASQWMAGRVLIIDEVERGLHPAQQVRVLEELRELSRTQTVILTTHSETLLRAARANELLVVDLEETEHQVSTRVRSLMSGGVSSMLKREFASFSPIHGRVPTPLLLVEGPTDKWYLQNFVTSPDLYDWPQLADVQVTYGFGSQMVQYSRWLANNEIKHLCLLDNDRAGQQFRKKLEGQGVSEVVMLPWEGVIEDLYSGVVLEQALLQLAESAEKAALQSAIAGAKQGDKELGFRELSSIYAKSTKHSVDKVRLADQLNEMGASIRPDRVQQLRDSLGAGLEALVRH